MKIFFDTEFTGLHKGTTLISLGMVAEDGRTFYAEFLGYDRKQCDKWIKENVISKLKYSHVEDSWCNCNDEELEVVGYSHYVKMQLEQWLSRYDNVELVSDCCHYDMVLFIDIFGSAWDIPKQICPVCYDINQDIAKHYGVSQSEAFDMSREVIWEELAESNDEFSSSLEEEQKHNALWDAMIIKGIYEFMNNGQN